MKKLVMLSLILGLLTACSTANTTAKRVPFPEDEYLKLSSSGKGVITGQVYIETRDGDKVPKSGAKVVLNPVTSYSLQWKEETPVTLMPLEPPDSRISNYIREALTDAEGRFVIDNVPAGEYFVSSPIVWEGPGMVKSVYPLVSNGRIIVKQISVGEQDKKEVTLSTSIRLGEEMIDASQPNTEKMPVWTSYNY